MSEVLFLHTIACICLVYLLLVHFNLQHASAIKCEIRHERSSAILASCIQNFFGHAHLVSEYIFWDFCRDFFNYFEGMGGWDTSVVSLIWKFEFCITQANNVYIIVRLSKFNTSLYLLRYTIWPLYLGRFLKGVQLQLRLIQFFYPCLSVSSTSPKIPQPIGWEIIDIWNKGKFKWISALGREKFEEDLMVMCGVSLSEMVYVAWNKS